MNHISRRKLLAGAAGASGLALAGAAATWRTPSIKDIYMVSDALTYAAHRALLSGQPLAREFSRDMITKNFPVNGQRDPADDTYQNQSLNDFAGWNLSIAGLVAKPGAYSLAHLKSLPSRTQVTQQACEEGWSAIAEWTGAPLHEVLHAVGAQPEARYVVFETVDGWWDSIDMSDALHPQTLLAYGMNGRELPVAYGAPLRLRVERQLGYKNLKYVARMHVTGRLDNIGDGTGSGSHHAGFAWYAGI
jgi:DMSO/TMAO reductase YedYZ molybdopterin-dependent catalytic subunit